MGMIIGPTPWWQANLVVSLPLGGTLPDGSRVFCRAGCTAWIVAPSNTQVGQPWASGTYNGIDAPGTTCICAISEWTTLQSCLISRGFNPSDWFVPNLSQLQSGYNCRFFWDSFSCVSYWSSTEDSAANGFYLLFSNGGADCKSKAAARCVRAFRCVTY